MGHKNLADEILEKANQPVKENPDINEQINEFAQIIVDVLIREPNEKRRTHNPGFGKNP